MSKKNQQPFFNPFRIPAKLFFWSTIGCVLQSTTVNAQGEGACVEFDCRDCESEPDTRQKKSATTLSNKAQRGGELSFSQVCEQCCEIEIPQQVPVDIKTVSISPTSTATPTDVQEPQAPVEKNNDSSSNSNLSWLGLLGLIALPVGISCSVVSAICMVACYRRWQQANSLNNHEVGETRFSTDVILGTLYPPAGFGQSGFLQQVVTDGYLLTAGGFRPQN